MTNSPPLPRIGIYGQDLSATNERHGCKLWNAGVAASLVEAGAEPVVLGPCDERAWEDVLEGIHGVVVVGHDHDNRRLGAEAEQLCVWCHDHKMPLLAIDHGLLVLNSSHGGTLHFDLPREMPEALQHRHPPERGLRHAINVLEDTGLASLYGEGEVVVNSEHRRGIQRVARGFRVCAQALDGIVEAIEAEDEGWFALAVQWQPASATASGLDIQLFRGVVNAAARDLAAAEDLACSAA